MKFTSSLVCLAAASATAHTYIKEEDFIKTMDPECPTVKHYTAEYHQDTVCNRASQNAFKLSLGRGAIQQRLELEGTNNVPSEKTAFCPQTVTPMTSEDATTGFDTVWLMENTASTPVVVAFMLQQPDGTVKEVSAFDSNISPPNHDPKAILQPNQWKSLHTHEGHVFHVREILKDGGMGQVLLQHRVGLVPVTNKYGHELNCDPNDPDLEPKVEVNGVPDIDPNYARELPRVDRPCNTLDIGFRNEVGCPLNAYYTGMYQMKGTAKPRGDNLPFKTGGNNATDEADGPHTPKSCHEVFKFHLGLQDRAPDFMMNWNSKVKYEATYVGHNFVFRYAKDERIVVDSVALHPTRIIDCPGLKNQINVGSVSAGEAIITPIMQPRSEDFGTGFVLPHVNTMMMAMGANGTTVPAAMAPNSTTTTTAGGSNMVLPSPSQQRRNIAAANAFASSL
jgi:hypothetical protein